MNALRTTAAATLWLLLLATGCSDSSTEILVTECSPSSPYGACPADEACIDGACVAVAGLCSPTNLSGSCTDGMTCFAGGCVLASSLCNQDNPTGPCESGNTCLEGDCIATADLCSSVNPTGTCAGTKSCDQGVCVEDGEDACTVHVYTEQPEIGVVSRAILTVDGLQFKDSSGDGQLDVYEDWRLAESCRARDLVGKLSVADKVGLMSEGSTIGSGSADGVLPQSAQDNIVVNHLRQALLRFGSRSGSELAVYLNNVQELCEAQPFSVPFVVTGDPIHGFGTSTNATTGVQTIGASTVVSAWPYPLGLGAINDATVTRQYGDTVRAEFMAMGLRWQLGPMADLGTEPRWSRVQNVFGENTFHVAKHVRACIEGFQGTGDGGLHNGIAATVKHFPGAGANEDGKDSHSRPGKFNVFPGDNFDYHHHPFQVAIDTGVAALMPCYSIFKEQTSYDWEQVGSAFSTGLITDYLKQTLGYSGMVTSDWGTMSSTAWGVESLTQPERAAMFIKAGSHQLGSDSFTIVRTAHEQGLISDADLDAAAVKILEMSFKLGIFENPYVDEAAAGTIVRSATHRRNGFVAQKKAIVLLRNQPHGGGNTRYLPISGSRFTDANGNATPDPGEYIDDIDGDGTVEVYFDGVVDGLAGSDMMDDVLSPYDYATPAAGTTLAVAAATSPATADLAVIRITARKGTYFGLDAGVPLSFDAPFPGVQTDSNYAAAVKDRNKVIDLLRVRDGYTNAAGTFVAATRPNLKIILVMHMDRPGIVKPFINGLTTLDETLGQPGSYPLVSNPANIRADGLGGVDAFLVDFGAIDRAVLDVLFNVNLPTEPAGYVYGQARLPMEIPSSDADVEAQFEDVPADTWNPTYALGSGSTY